MREKEKTNLVYEYVKPQPEPRIQAVRIVEKPQKRIRQVGSGTKYAEDFE